MDTTYNASTATSKLIHTYSLTYLCNLLTYLQSAAAPRYYYQVPYGIFRGTHRGTTSFVPHNANTNRNRAAEAH